MNNMSHLNSTCRENTAFPKRKKTVFSLRRKKSVMQNKNDLLSTFKSRDITVPSKVRLVKAMVFPLVMYGCESWTVMLLNCGVGEDS